MPRGHLCNQWHQCGESLKNPGIQEMWAPVTHLQSRLHSKAGMIKSKGKEATMQLLREGQFKAEGFRTGQENQKRSNTTLIPVSGLRQGREGEWQGVTVQLIRSRADKGPGSQLSDPTSLTIQMRIDRRLVWRAGWTCWRDIAEL